jgi:hypothetical protein
MKTLLTAAAVAALLATAPAFAKDEGMGKDHGKAHEEQHGKKDKAAKDQADEGKSAAHRMDDEKKHHGQGNGEKHGKGKDKAKD